MKIIKGVQNRLDEIVNETYYRFHLRDLPPNEIMSIIRSGVLQYHQEQSSPPPLDTFKEETFRIFYEKYGKKVGRVTAHRRWMKLKKADIENILETVDDFVRSTPEPQYRPHPATYIAQRRWEDEITPARKPMMITKEKNTWSYQ